MESKEESIATLTIRGAGDMTDKRKKEIAEWLRNQAKALLKDGKNYSNRFTARYLINH